MTSEFQARQDAKITRLFVLAQKNHMMAEQVCDQAQKMADVIPMGQPILIGHHSEKRDRNYRDRIWSKFMKSAELEEKSKWYTQRAISAENGKLAISSDDPDAIELLRRKLQGLKDSHKLMVDSNKILKSKKLTADQKKTELAKLGISEGKAIAKLTPNYLGQIGYEGWELSNSSANIRRIELRIKDLEKQQTEESKEYQIGDIQIVDSVEDNRVMVTFPGIPDESIRARLKFEGFRWSPSNRAWQAYRSAAWKIPDLIRFFSVMPAYVDPNNYLFVEVA